MGDVGIMDEERSLWPMRDMVSWDMGVWEVLSRREVPTDEEEVL